MSNVAGKDDNGFPVIFGVSHLDGITPVQIQFDSNRHMMVDSTTTIAFNPASVGDHQNTNDYPFAKATSSADDSTVRPWVVNASTGAVLIAE